MIWIIIILVWGQNWKRKHKHVLLALLSLWELGWAGEPEGSQADQAVESQRACLMYLHHHSGNNYGTQLLKDIHHISFPCLTHLQLCDNHIDSIEGISSIRMSLLSKLYLGRCVREQTKTTSPQWEPSGRLAGTPSPPSTCVQRPWFRRQPHHRSPPAEGRAVPPSQSSLGVLCPQQDGRLVLPCEAGSSSSAVTSYVPLYEGLTSTAGCLASIKPALERKWRNKQLFWSDLSLISVHIYICITICFFMLLIFFSYKEKLKHEQCRFICQFYE